MEYLTFVNLGLLALDIQAFYRKPDSIYLFFRFCFSLIIGFGIIFLQIMNSMVGYKFVLPDLGTIETCYLIGYAGIRLGSLVGRVSLFPKRDVVPLPFGNPSQVSRSSRMGLRALGVVSMLAVAAYIAVNGISFGEGSYQERYEDAQGMGIILRLFPAFLPYAAYRLAVTKNGKEFARASLVLLAVTGLMFVALDGYRQLLISGVLLIAIIAIKRRYIPIWVQVALALSVFPAFVGLSFLRYGGEAVTAGFTDPVKQAFYYIQGDLFPLDAPIRILWWCDYRQCPGLDVFTNHLSLLVPRFLWPDKPAILLDAAGYYTQMVIAYNRAVTLSSTIIGESILIGGMAAILPICFASGWLARVLSRWMDTSSGMMKFILLANVPMGFFWVREGLENGVLRTFFILAFFVIGLLLAPMVSMFMSGSRSYKSQSKAYSRPTAMRS